MESNSDSDSELLENIARLHLFHYQTNSTEAISLDDVGMEQTRTPWIVPTRDVRELIAAEEILRFASRPVNSRTTQDSKVLTDSTSDSKSFRFIDNSVSTTEELASEITGTKGTLASKSGIRKPVQVASAAGTRGSDPTQSATGDAVVPSTSKSQDTNIPVVAAVPNDDQQNYRPSMYSYRPNKIPVTNRILAALAQSKESERSASNSPVISKPNRSIDKNQSKKNEELLGRYLEHLKRMQNSDLSSSSNSDIPDSQATPRPSQSTSTCSGDEITILNKHLVQTNQLEEIVTKTMQVTVERLLKSKYELKSLGKLLKTKLELLQNDIESGEVDEDEGEGGGIQQNSQDKPAGDNAYENYTYEEDPEQGNHCPDDDDYTTATTSDLSDYQIEIVENSDETDDQPIDGSNPNDNNAGDFHVTDDNETEPSEFPELDDESLRLEWSRSEKRRLSTVLRDLSREIKRKELNHKKARLIKKGRVISQAIENKICAINKEIMAVNKKSLRYLALPLDQIQEYDWDRVANVLNAKRTPEECRMYWKLFLHPSINSSEWTEIEIKAMEKIAKRYNFRNWDAIAEELNTGRNGQQCYLFYRQHMCPHTELRGKCNKN